MRTRDRFTAFITSVAVSAIATFALLSFFGDGESGADLHPDGRTTVGTGGLVSPSPTPTEQPPRFATLDGANRAGGYAFRYPPTWRLSTDETVSRITSPNGNTVVSFGFGVSGSLEESAAALAGLLRDTYDVSRMRAARPTTVNALPARVVTGSALNADEVKIFFQAFSVRAEGENYAISVFSRRPTGDAVDEIVESFESTGAG